MTDMDREDGFIEVTAILDRRIPIIRWILPVRRQRIRMIFDVYSWVLMAQALGIGFDEFDKVPQEDFLAWAVYAGMASWDLLQKRRPRHSVEEAERMTRGILVQDRLRISEVIQESRLLGRTIKEFSEAGQPGKVKAPSGQRS